MSEHKLSSNIIAGVPSSGWPWAIHKILPKRVFMPNCAQRIFFPHDLSLPWSPATPKHSRVLHNIPWLPLSLAHCTKVQTPTMTSHFPTTQLTCPEHLSAELLAEFLLPRVTRAKAQEGAELKKSWFFALGSVLPALMWQQLCRDHRELSQKIHWKRNAVWNLSLQSSWRSLVYQCRANYFFMLPMKPPIQINKGHLKVFWSHLIWAERMEVLQQWIQIVTSISKRESNLFEFLQTHVLERSSTHVK